jgi:hypothetical protein
LKVSNSTTYHPPDDATIKNIISQISAFKDGELAIFCGAGISIDSGLPCAISLLDATLDSLGILKRMKGYEDNSRLTRFMSRMLKKSDPVAFLFLSIKEDAFITMIYLRHGSHRYNGMSARDWRIFLGSVAISNIYWTLAAYMGISAVEWVLQVVISGV